VAKLDWSSSYLALRLSAKDEAEAIQITDSTRNYLHALKYQNMQALIEIDLTDTSIDRIIAINTFKSKIELLNEMLAFFGSATQDDPLTTSE
jgi:hypothetical protein